MVPAKRSSDQVSDGDKPAGGRVTYSFRAADAVDATAIAALVDAAYGQYVERLAMLPGPTTLDYDEVIRSRHVTVAEHRGQVVGVLVLNVDQDKVMVENVAVHPTHRGVGLGRALLERAEAEARRAGSAELRLYTHEKMSENLALYAKAGYVEFDRRPQGGFELVYLSKPLM